MAVGMRLVVLTENGACGETALNTLFEQLGFSIRVLNEGEQENRVLDVIRFGTESQVTEGLTEITMQDPCYVDSGQGVRLMADDDGHTLGAAERVGIGGDLVVIGDIRILDDGGYLDEKDNGALADNLVLIEPAEE